MEEPKAPSMTKWHECKAIAEGLSPQAERDVEARAVVLARLAAGSEQGARLAAQLAQVPTGQIIQVAEEDMPPEFLELWKRKNQS